MGATADDPFSADSVEREIALVALEAAALARRIFPLRGGPDRLSAEARQVLLALALTGSTSQQEDVLTPRALVSLLALDRERALDALAELVSAGLAEHVDLDVLEHEDLSPLDVGCRPTEAGVQTALDLARYARRFLPGWPPEWPAPAGRSRPIHGE
jgi:hypothetical protein